MLPEELEKALAAAHPELPTSRGWSDDPVRRMVEIELPGKVVLGFCGLGRECNLEAATS